MRKLLALLMVLCMLFSVATVFAGCEDSGKKKSSSSKKDDEDDDDDDDDDDKSGDNTDDNNNDNTGDENEGEIDVNEPSGNETTEPAGNKATEPEEDEEQEEDPVDDPGDVDVEEDLEELFLQYLVTINQVDSERIQYFAQDFLVEAGTWGNNTLNDIIDAMNDPDTRAYYMEESFFVDDYLGENIVPEITEFSFGYIDSDLKADILAEMEDYYGSFGFSASKVQNIVSINALYNLTGSVSSWNRMEADNMYAICYDGNWNFFTYATGSYSDGEAYAYVNSEIESLIFSFYYAVQYK